IHLPAITMSEEVENLSKRLNNKGLEIKGLYLEGSDSLGNIYIISNKASLGVTEENIICTMKEEVLKLIADEYKFREILTGKCKYELEDKIYRALAILQHAVLLDFKEALDLISKVRLGVELSLIPINKEKINKEELKNYKKILEDMYIYKSNICEVRYFIDKKGILNDFVIVDTPGLNQSLLENTNSRMLDYYNHADGIIWILDSQNVISKSSYELLEELKHNYSIEKNKDNIICVVNKIDTIKNKIKDKQKIIEKVDLLYEQNFKDIVMISARNAINGILNNDTNLIDISNIKALENSIEINFKKKSEKIQVKSKQQGLKLMSKKIIEYINEYKRDLYFEIYKLNKNKKSIKEKLDLVKIYTLEHVKIYISFENLIKNDINVEIRQLENIINK
ncbi:hypothetical protein GKD08_17730, partial [Paeniclostridium sordellii]|uniref:dynamin family protein n=1 Tax=Paraclostridium sordellii TaxID=1505 RepID=UPI00139B94E8